MSVKESPSISQPIFDRSDRAYKLAQGPQSIQMQSGCLVGAQNGLISVRVARDGRDARVVVRGAAIGPDGVQEVNSAQAGATLEPEQYKGLGLSDSQSVLDTLAIVADAKVLIPYLVEDTEVRGNSRSSVSLRLASWDGQQHLEAAIGDDLFTSDRVSSPAMIAAAFRGQGYIWCRTGEGGVVDLTVVDGDGQPVSGVAADLPGDFSLGTALSYENLLHVVTHNGQWSHHVWDGETMQAVGGHLGDAAARPRPGSSMSMAVLNGLLFLFYQDEGSTQQQVFFDGQRWSEVSSDPGIAISSTRQVATYGGKIWAEMGGSIGDIGVDSTVLDTNCLALDGSHYLELPTTMDGLADIGTGSMTVETWIKIDTPALTPVLHIASPGGTLSVQVHESGEVHIGGAGEHLNAQPTETTLFDGEWHHLAVVRDADRQEMSVFLDGRVLRTFTHGVSFDDLSSPTQIYCGHVPYLSVVANASFDEVRIWSTARAAFEIDGCMFLQPRPHAAGLVGRFSFDDGTATNAVDGATGTVKSSQPDARRVRPSNLFPQGLGAPDEGRAEHVSIQTRMIDETVENPDGSFSKVTRWRVLVQGKDADGAGLLPQTFMGLGPVIGNQKPTPIYYDVSYAGVRRLTIHTGTGSGDSGVVFAGKWLRLTPDGAGRVQFSIDANTSDAKSALIAPTLLLRPSFLPNGEGAILIEPDRTEHARLANISDDDLAAVCAFPAWWTQSQIEDYGTMVRTLMATTVPQDVGGLWRRYAASDSDGRSSPLVTWRNCLMPDRPLPASDSTSDLNLSCFVTSTSTSTLTEDSLERIAKTSFVARATPTVTFDPSGSADRGGAAPRSLSDLWDRIEGAAEVAIGWVGDQIQVVIDGFEYIIETLKDAVTAVCALLDRFVDSVTAFFDLVKWVFDPSKASNAIQLVQTAAENAIPCLRLAIGEALDTVSDFVEQGEDSLVELIEYFRTENGTSGMTPIMAAESSADPAPVGLSYFQDGLTGFLSDSDGDGFSLPQGLQDVFDRISDWLEEHFEATAAQLESMVDNVQQRINQLTNAEDASDAMLTLAAGLVELLGDTVQLFLAVVHDILDLLFEGMQFLFSLPVESIFPRLGAWLTAALDLSSPVTFIGLFSIVPANLLEIMARAAGKTSGDTQYITQSDIDTVESWLQGGAGAKREDDDNGDDDARDAWLKFSHAQALSGGVLSLFSGICSTISAAVTDDKAQKVLDILSLSCNYLALWTHLPGPREYAEDDVIYGLELIFTVEAFALIFSDTVQFIDPSSGRGKDFKAVCMFGTTIMGVLHAGIAGGIFRQEKLAHWDRYDDTDRTMARLRLSENVVSPVPDVLVFTDDIKSPHPVVLALKASIASCEAIAAALTITRAGIAIKNDHLSPRR